jgi:MFS transporter, Spinster family, sphingosine-1-phosphate transporter
MIVHSVASVPLGILADKWIRKNIIAFGVIFWSVATFISGFAQNFYQLLVARSAVGVGEAAYGPSATSLIADNFPDEQRAKVSSIFHLGMFAGGTLGMVLAGIIGTYWGWRICFFIVGVPGFVLALVSYLIYENKKTDHHLLELKKSSVSSLFKSSSYILTLLAGVMLTFTSGSIISWITEFLVRYHNFTVSEASLTIGSIVLVTGILGIYAGGYVADFCHKKYRLPRSFIIAVGFIISTPFLYLIITVDTRIFLIISLVLATFFMALYYGPVVAFIQDMVPSNLKATAYAFYIFVVHLFGDTVSPSVIGKLSDSYNLKSALILPVATNLIGALLFLLITFMVYRKTLNN